MSDPSELFRYESVYSDQQIKLIEQEFSKNNEEHYLEHAGATLYSKQQLSQVFAELSGNIFGNPHANNKSSKFSDDNVDQVRFKVLQYFNTNSDEYSVIFTSGATAALKLVAESFQYKTNGRFVYLRDNHTSVLGMREYSKNVIALERDTAFQIFNKTCTESKSKKFLSNSLFVYPAQCNFSGTKYPLSWIHKTQNGALNNLHKLKDTNWFCMLDAACFVSTNLLDLSIYKPDFICMSFYKIFGYPTGLGALIVKNSSAHVLEKVYFGGGTVLMALASEQTHVTRTSIHERFEDGTLPFLSIISLRHGFELLQRLSLTMNDISKHTFNLASYVFHRLKLLKHANGEPVACLYHDNNFEDINQQGGIVNFNLLRPNGKYIGYSEVLHVSNLYGIHLRTGCFCNPGACQRHLKLSTDDVKHHFKSGHVCGDQHDLIDGFPTGSVRISFGYISTKQNADAFLNMINDYFVSKPIQSNYKNKYKTDSYTDFKGVLEQIFIYPVKSCAAYSIKTNWKIVKTGLQYDRQWMIVNSNGVAVTQKTDTRLALIRPKIMLKQGLLQLNYQGVASVTLPLNISHNTFIPNTCQTKVCRDRIQGFDCGDDIAEWLVDVLDIPGLRLLQQYNDNTESVRKYQKDDLGSQLSLSNEAQFLLLNLASVRWLSDHISTDTDFDTEIDNIVARFRPNLVVEFPEPFVENSLSQLQIGQMKFNNVGACTRCQMICINQSTGEKTIEPLQTISKVFNGKIKFGIYLNNASNICGTLTRGDSILWLNTNQT